MKIPLIVFGYERDQIIVIAELFNKLLSVLDKDALGIVVYALTCKVVDRSIGISLVDSDVADTCCSDCKLETVDTYLALCVEHVVRFASLYRE